MTAHKKPFILIDGSSYLYRAFHAMPSLRNSKSMPTGAVYGMLNMLRKLLSDYDPELIAVVFDAKGKTFRDDLYEKYKANRSAMPSELIQQIDIIHTCIAAMGLPILMIEGVEADDVIGTLATMATLEGIETLVSTGDKDLAQLVNEHVTLVNTMTGSVLTPKTVPEKFGIPAELIVDYLTLVGDTVDNIPGVPQVGPKTAVKWLLEYGTLDNIVAKAHEIKGKVGENLRASLSQLPLAKSLATIKADMQLNIKIADLVRKPFNTAQLIELYQELEFKNWLADLLEKKSVETPHEIKPIGYEIILTAEALATWLTALKQAELFAFAVETTRANYMGAEIVGIAFAIVPGKVAYVPFGHTTDTRIQLQRDAVLKQLAPILEDKNIKKVGQNLKYTLEILANHHINLCGIAYDTMLESYILDSSSNKHDKESLALKFLGQRATPYADLAGKGAKQLTFAQLPMEVAAAYMTETVDIILRVHDILWKRYTQEPGLKHIFEEIELPLLPILAKMERCGVLIDPEMLKKQGIELEHRLLELEKLAYTLAGTPFNLNSPKQLQEVLFTLLKLPVLQKTPTGQPSTADAVLQELALEYPLPKIIIEYRSLSKLISTYTSTLPEQINPVTHRVHTSYNQTGAATGRLSSSDPNLQNIPIRTAEGRRIRQAFIAPPGYKIVTADYSQIELRIMAHISKDPNLLKAFAQNLDIHSATAAEVLEIPLDKITSDERRSAKAINFGLIYGMSAFGLAKQLGIERNDAQNYIDRYFTRYPLVKEYMDKTRKLSHTNGYVETLWGRRLYLPDINSSQIMRQKAAERAAINGPLQGSAADIIKRAMIFVDQALQKAKLHTKMIMQVHDELVFEVPENELVVVIELIRTEMMRAGQLKVPLIVDIGVGDNWNEAAES